MGKNNCWSFLCYVFTYVHDFLRFSFFFKKNIFCAAMEFCLYIANLKSFLFSCDFLRCCSVFESIWIGKWNVVKNVMNESFVNRKDCKLKQFFFLFEFFFYFNLSHLIFRSLISEYIWAWIAKDYIKRSIFTLIPWLFYLLYHSIIHFRQYIFGKLFWLLW